MGDGDAQSPSGWVPGGSHLAHKGGNKSSRLWAHRGLCPELGPTPHTGEMLAALRNGSEDLGMPYSRKTYPSTCCWVSSAVSQDLTPAGPKGMEYSQSSVLRSTLL